MKKRLFVPLASALLALALLVSCVKAPAPETPVTVPPQKPSPETVTPAADTAPEQTETPAYFELLPDFELSAEELSELWARIDGSTATIPLTEALYGVLGGGGSSPPVHNTTFPAYYHLLHGAADLIFVTYPSEYEFTEAKNLGVELEIIPIVKDALVFLVNASNYANDVTLSQLRDIYTGAITNWRPLGGYNEDIIPYQRTAGSGSQTLFLKLLMDGVTPMDPPAEWISETMGSLVESVSGYNNAENAIGYSMFYYVNNMYGNSRFKLLSIDGVKPTRDTIAKGEYALEDFYYAVLRSDTPADSPARKLIRWLQTETGQLLAAEAGYIPLRPLAGAAYNSDFDPVYLGDTDNSSGTGGTTLIQGEGVPQIGTENVRPPLSDLFFDGFNFIRHINSEILRQLESVDNESFRETLSDMVLIRPFTGIPYDYPHFQLPHYGTLQIDFPEGNPFFKRAISFGIPLTDDISPYGTEPSVYSVTYDYFGEFLPNTGLFTLNVSLPNAPDIARIINERLRAWESGFAFDDEAVKAIESFLEWWTDMLGNPEDYVYRLQPSTALWQNYLSVSYLLATYDGPSNYQPTVYNICFDINTGETVSLAELLPYDSIDFSKAGLMTPVYYKDGESAGGAILIEGYVPPAGTVITEAWSDTRFQITEPSGRVLLVFLWDGIE